MATIHLAVDAVTGLALPDGQIKGLSDSEAGLRAAGFAADPYTGNRLSTIDDEAAGWDDDAQPGWYLIGAAVMPKVPSTDLDEMKDAMRAFQNQVVAWSAELTHRGVSQKPAKVTQGHERLRNALGAMYLICRNATHTAANRKIWATRMVRGALRIQSVDDFYSTDTVDFPPQGQTVGEPGMATSRWYCWVDISNPSVAVALDGSVYVTGNVPASVNLLGEDWIDAIAA